MARDPPSSGSEPDTPASDTEEYKYESEGEEMLGNSARTLLRESGGDYRLARAALLAYTRNDRTYVSSVSLTRPAGLSHRRPPSERVVVSSGTPTAHPVYPTPQPLPSTSQNPPPPRNISSRTRFPTPPPTPAVLRHAPTLNATTSHENPAPQPLPREEREPPEYHPTPIPGPQRKYYTPLYPLLVEHGMLGYFKMEDGVSKRPPEDVRRMLTEIKSNRFWLGDIRYVDTTAISGVTAKQDIHQPTLNATTGRWYCIVAGLEVGIFESWTDVAPHSLGISGAIQRAFNNKHQAYCSFQYALILGTVRLVPRS